MSDLIIPLGWWIIPVAITASTMAWAMWPREGERYGGLGAGVAGMFRLGIAFNGSMIVWLFWSVLA